MAAFTPAPKALSTDELNEIRCALRSGNEPTLEMGQRLMATIDSLHQALLWRRSRELGEEGALDLSQGYTLAGPGQAHAVVESRAPEMPEAIGRRQA